eukprot:CAMPEP_0172616726 /NCGR_PEP_ID=MMETSP1068-20121228/67006_1 /TAXON_ID=35684 /ORGANISM="Pseudopedinella elastica, Strain CCMP716" /LENGTH=165 /DNA_ID=CAMNT_0013422251 /DNA_START=26 /DNA_END=519 /DNA_ORIENTATION=-
MHSADWIERRRWVLVFRGGDGRVYLNQLHALDVDSYHWRRLEASGPPPERRANHASATDPQGLALFIFGGWDGRRRLNDLHRLDTRTLTWSSCSPSGPLPSPRAGMTLGWVSGMLLLFGGSGAGAKCFNDLQMYDPEANRWVLTCCSHGLADDAAGTGLRDGAQA